MFFARWNFSPLFPSLPKFHISKAWTISINKSINACEKHAFFRWRKSTWFTPLWARKVYNYWKPDNSQSNHKIYLNNFTLFSKLTNLPVSGARWDEEGGGLGAGVPFFNLFVLVRWRSCWIVSTRQFESCFIYVFFPFFCNLCLFVVNTFSNTYKKSRSQKWRNTSNM